MNLPAALLLEFVAGFAMGAGRASGAWAVDAVRDRWESRGAGAAAPVDAPCSSCTHAALVHDPQGHCHEHMCPCERFTP
jgi:hypothetical protein